jgi:endonuclease G
MWDRTQRARNFLDKITGPAGAEMMLSGSALESMAEANELPTAEQRLVRGTIEKLATNRELSPPEQFALEAIIIPDKRPAIDIVNGDFQIAHPLWQHFATDPIKPRIRSVLASIGRVEVFGIPSLPYGGTAFVVGPGIIMTNRHVAELFASGLGRRDLVFRPGLGSGIDFKRERSVAEQQFLRATKIVMIHPYWDLALLQVDGLAEQHPSLVLSHDAPAELAGRDVAVIGYPAFDPRNPADVQNRVFDGVYYVKRLQPGKLGNRRSVESFGHSVSAMTHDASTLGGNSGSCVFDVSTGSIVALHFAGVYLDANFSVPAAELARDQHVIDAGVRFEDVVRGDSNLTREWWSSIERAPAGTRPPSGGGPVVSPPPGSASGDGRGAVPPASGTSDGATWTIPLQITVRVGRPSREQATSPGEAASVAPIVERMVAPIHDEDYSTRQGYAADFLGVDVPMPTAVDESRCAPLADGSHVLNYHHFSVVMHKRRRLAMFTASNVDGNPNKKNPEKRKSYTRDALGGLRKSDTELWFTDSRISVQHQLPDRFFTKDQGAFDKGHIVRREDVAWGDTYEAVQFANGDTFHTTNCSPRLPGSTDPIPPRTGVIWKIWCPPRGAAIA